MAWVLQSKEIPQEVCKIIKLFAIKRNHNLETPQPVWLNDRSSIGVGSDIIYSHRSYMIIDNLMQYALRMQRFIELINISLYHEDMTDDTSLDYLIMKLMGLKFIMFKIINLKIIHDFYQLRFPEPFSWDQKEDFLYEYTKLTHSNGTRLYSNIVIRTIGAFIAHKSAKNILKHISEELSTPDVIIQLCTRPSDDSSARLSVLTTFDQVIYF